MTFLKTQRNVFGCLLHATYIHNFVQCNDESMTFSLNNFMINNEVELPPRYDNRDLLSMEIWTSLAFKIAYFDSTVWVDSYYYSMLLNGKSSPV